MSTCAQVKAMPYAGFRSPSLSFQPFVRRPCLPAGRQVADQDKTPAEIHLQK